MPLTSAHYTPERLGRGDDALVVPAAGAAVRRGGAPVPAVAAAGATTPSCTWAACSTSTCAACAGRTRPGRRRAPVRGVRLAAAGRPGVGRVRPARRTHGGGRHDDAPPTVPDGARAARPARGRPRDRRCCATSTSRGCSTPPTSTWPGAWPASAARTTSRCCSPRRSPCARCAAGRSASTSTTVPGPRPARSPASTRPPGPRRRGREPAGRGRGAAPRRTAGSTSTATGARRARSSTTSPRRDALARRWSTRQPSTAALAAYFPDEDVRRPARGRGDGLPPLDQRRDRRARHRQDDDDRPAPRCAHGRWRASEPLRIALAAPTGKAAARMGQALRAGDATAATSRARRRRPAAGARRTASTTLERRRRCTGCSGGGRTAATRFRHDRANPLPLRRGGRRRDLDDVADAGGAAARGDAARRRGWCSSATPTSSPRSRPVPCSVTSSTAGRARRPGPASSACRAGSGRTSASSPRRSRPATRTRSSRCSARAGAREGDDDGWVLREDTGPALDDLLRRHALATPTRPRPRVTSPGCCRSFEAHRLLCAHREGPFGVAQWNRHVERLLMEATDQEWLRRVVRRPPVHRQRQRPRACGCGTATPGWRCPATPPRACRSSGVVGDDGLACPRPTPRPGSRTSPPPTR